MLSAVLPLPSALPPCKAICNQQTGGHATNTVAHGCAGLGSSAKHAPSALSTHCPCRSAVTASSEAVLGGHGCRT
jgi:hypothetical protein